MESKGPTPDLLAAQKLQKKREVAGKLGFSLSDVDEEINAAPVLKEQFLAACELAIAEKKYKSGYALTRHDEDVVHLFIIHGRKSSNEKLEEN